MKLSIHESQQRLVFNNFMSFFATTCGLQTLQGCRYCLPAADFALFNAVLDTQIDNPSIHEIIERIMRIYSKKQFCWWVTDFVKPKHLGDALTAAGFQAASSFKGMYYDLSNPLLLPTMPLHIQVTKVIEANQLDAWLNPLQVGFALDVESANFCINSLKNLFHDQRFHHFYVKKAEKTVGIGSLFVENGVSGFYNLAVLPEYRGNKIATALKVYRLQQSLALGAKVAILQSSNMGQALDQRLGFKPVCDFVPYLSPI